MRRILVIEDDQSVAWLLKKILGKKYKVTRFANGLEACAWLSDGNQTDLIVSDIKMPLMTGVELLENFQTSGLYKEIPVIIVSGVNDSSVRKKCETLGALAFMIKPFDPEKLLREIHEQFEQKMFA